MRGDFGRYLKQLREEAGIGLREFCLKNRLDPSNYSKYERGALTPPGEDILRKFARGLGISTKANSKAWQQVTALAAAERGTVPTDLARNEAVIALLPAFYQKLRDHVSDGQDPTDVLMRALGKEAVG
jgi:transcriptional regulator with XRE-family HTH domain